MCCNTHLNSCRAEVSTIDDRVTRSTKYLLRTRYSPQSYSATQLKLVDPPCHDRLDTVPRLDWPGFWPFFSTWDCVGKQTHSDGSVS